MLLNGVKEGELQPLYENLSHSYFSIFIIFCHAFLFWTAPHRPSPPRTKVYRPGNRWSDKEAHDWRQRPHQNRHRFPTSRYGHGCRWKIWNCQTLYSRSEGGNHLSRLQNHHQNSQHAWARGTGRTHPSRRHQSSWRSIGPRGKRGGRAKRGYYLLQCECLQNTNQCPGRGFNQKNARHHLPRRSNPSPRRTSTKNLSGWARIFWQRPKYCATQLTRRCNWSRGSTRPALGPKPSHRIWRWKLHQDHQHHFALW